MADVHVGEDNSEQIPQVLREHLEAERRAFLTLVDSIDRRLGRTPRQVACPNCNYVFDPKRVRPHQHGT